ARAVRSLAAPVLAVGARLCLVERNDLAVDQAIAGRRDVHLIAGHHEAIAFAATPFAGRVTVGAARNPAVVSESLRRNGRKHADHEQPSQEPGHESFLSGPGRAIVRLCWCPPFAARLARSRRWSASAMPYRGSPSFAPGDSYCVSTV